MFCDGETYVVDDFKQLIKGSDGSVLWQSGEPDKGHFEELSRFGDAIASGGPSPIPVRRARRDQRRRAARRGSACWGGSTATRHDRSGRQTLG